MTCNAEPENGQNKNHQVNVIVHLSPGALVVTD
jgi:hypothetical protein